MKSRDSDLMDVTRLLHLFKLSILLSFFYKSIYVYVIDEVCRIYTIKMLYVEKAQK